MNKSDIEWGLKSIAAREQGKMICFRCSEVITPCKLTDKATRQTYATENGELLCRGTWEYHAPFFRKARKRTHAQKKNDAGTRRRLFAA